MCRPCYVCPVRESQIWCMCTIALRQVIQASISCNTPRFATVKRQLRNFAACQFMVMSSRTTSACVEAFLRLLQSQCCSTKVLAQIDDCLNECTLSITVSPRITTDKQSGSRRLAVASSCASIIALRILRSGLS